MVVSRDTSGTLSGTNATLATNVAGNVESKSGIHRNGIVQALLGSAGAQIAFQSALGGPGFGTPRAVEALVKKTPPQK